MDAIPFIILLIPFGAVTLFSGLFLFFNLFHLWRYGVEGTGTTLLALSYVVIFGLVIGLTLGFLAPFSWSGTFSLADLIPEFSSPSSFGL